MFRSRSVGFYCYDPRYVHAHLVVRKNGPKGKFAVETLIADLVPQNAHGELVDPAIVHLQDSSGRIVSLKE